MNYRTRETLKGALMLSVFAAAAFVAVVACSGCSSTKGGSTSAKETLEKSSGGTSRTQRSDTTVHLPPAPAPATAPENTPATDVSVTPAGIVITQHTDRSDVESPAVEKRVHEAAATQPSSTGVGKFKGGEIGGDSADGFTVGGYSFDSTSASKGGAILFGLLMAVMAYFAMKSRNWIAAAVCIVLAVIAFVFPQYLLLLVLAGLGLAAYVVYRKHVTNAQLVGSTQNVLEMLKAKGGDLYDLAKVHLAAGQDEATKAIVDEHKAA